MIMSEINVTPLVDVMLVLLIMFMVTAPLLQQGIEVDVPKTSATGLEVKGDPLIIVIQANKQITIAKNPIALSDLKIKMKSLSGILKDKPVFVQADQNVSYGVVAEAMAEIKAAGITNIGLVTLPKDK